MSALAEFKKAERALAIQYRALQEMKQSPELQKAMEFEKALDDFLAIHKMPRRALYDLLAFDIDLEKKANKTPAIKSATTPAKKPAAKPGQKRRAPIMKIRTFKNPHTGQELTVRGNRDGTFNEWNAKYGVDIVRTWKISEEVAPAK